MRRALLAIVEQELGQGRLVGVAEAEGAMAGAAAAREPETGGG